MISRPHADGLEERLPSQRSHDIPRLCPTPAPLGWPVSVAQPPRRPSSHDIAVVQASLAAVRRRPVTFAETFYAHLFEMQPAARSMFADDMTAQMQRMTDALLAMLAALRHDDTAPTPAEDNLAEPALERALYQLGVLHRDRFSVLPEHYLYIAHALTRAVRDVAGPAWSGSLSSSWIALTQWITGHMLEGHHRGSPRH